MFKKIKLINNYLFNTPEGNVKVHFWLTILWVIMVPIGVFWLKNSIPFLVLVSIYANLVGHWSSFQAARAECKVDKGNKAAAKR